MQLRLVRAFTAPSRYKNTMKGDYKSKGSLLSDISIFTYMNILPDRIGSIFSGALVIVAIWLITIEVPHYSLMIGFSKLLIMAITAAMLIFAVLGLLWWGQLSGEDRYVAAGCSLLFPFVICMGLFSAMHRVYASHDCVASEYALLSYQPRYAAGYGAMKGKKIKANQWVIVAMVDGKQRSFTLHKEITVQGVTNTINLEFCKGLFDIKYLRE